MYKYSHGLKSHAYNLSGLFVISIKRSELFQADTIWKRLLTD